MDNKNNKDAFADTSLGGGDKYLKRHKDAVRIEKAEAVDKRIAEFYARKHDLQWAKEAIDFCDREEKAGQDIKDISKGIQDLARIKQEAKDILKAEERRIAEEKEKLRLKEEQRNLELQKEKDKLKLIEEQQNLELKKEKERLKLLAEEEKLKAEKHDEEVVNNLEKMINDVSNAKRNREWVEAVNNVNLTLKGMDKKIYNRVSNRYIFDSLLDESKDVETALDLDDEIIELNATRLKNKPWAEKVFNLEKRFNKKLDKYMKEKNTALTLMGFATKIYYGEEIANVESVILNVENDDIRSVIDYYETAKSQVETLRNAIYIDEFIDNFERRWKSAIEKIDALIKEDIELAKAKKLAEQEAKEKKKKADAEERERIRLAEIEEAKRQKLLEEKKQRKLAKARKRRRILFALIINLLKIAIFGGVIVYGVLNFNNSIGQNVIGIGSAALICYICVKQSILFREIDILRIGITTIINLGLLTVTIVGMFVPALKAFSIPYSSALILSSIIHIFMIISNFYGFDIDDNTANFTWFNLGMIALAFTFITYIPGIIGYVVCGSILAGSSIISFFVAWIGESDFSDGAMYIIGTLMVIAGVVLAFFQSWEIFIVAGGLSIAGLMYTLGNRECGDDYSPFSVCLLFLVLIVFALASGITCATVNH